MTKGKTTWIQKDPSKGTAPNNYRPITCLPLMWKILTAQICEKIYHSFVWHRLFPEERMDVTREQEEYIYCTLSTQPKEKQNETEKCSYGVDWQQKAQRYSPAKLDNWLSKNVEDSWQSRKLYYGNHEKLESGIDRRWKKHIWGENPEKYLPWRCVLGITICNWDDVTQ